MNYTLTVLAHGREISWSTPYSKTAHKWFRFTKNTGRTIDSGEPVTLISLRRNGIEIKATMVSDAYAALR